MTHAKRGTKDNRKNPQYHVVAVIRKLRSIAVMIRPKVIVGSRSSLLFDPRTSSSMYGRGVANFWYLADVDVTFTLFLTISTKMYTGKKSLMTLINWIGMSGATQQ